MLRIRGLIVMLGMIISVSALAKAPLDPAQLASRLDQFNTYAKYPVPALDAGQLQRLVEGKIVKLRENPSGPDMPQRVLGFIVVDQPRAKTWLAIRDAHYSSLDSFTEIPLTATDQQQVQWYQFFDVPRPFADRHWLITVEDNHVMAKETNGVAWEHPWDLTPEGLKLVSEAMDSGRLPGLTKAQVDRAIYVDVNNGAWIAIELPDDRTLVGFHATSVIGGRVPDRLVADYAMWSLGSALTKIAERTPDVYTHYDAKHERVLGGDGVPIPTP